MMFGEQYNGVIDKETFKPKSVRPEGALSLYLEPYKSTGKRPKDVEGNKSQEHRK